MSQLKPLDPSLPIKTVEAVLESRDRNLQALSRRAKKVKSMKASLKEKKKPFHVNSLDKISKKRSQLKKDKKTRTLVSIKGLKKSAPHDKLLLVIRNDNPAGDNETAKILSQFRLTSTNHGRLIIGTTSALKDLAKVREYVFFGVPSKALVDRLFHTHAFYRRDGEEKAKPLNDNKLIEEFLGADDILCIEDLISTVTSAQPDLALVEKINCLLTPFHFRNYREVHGNLLKSGKHLKGEIKKIDKIINKIA